MQKLVDLWQTTGLYHFEFGSVIMILAAPPMIAIEAASRIENSKPGMPHDVSARAPSSVPKMPNCAAAPRSSVRGFASIGPKSVMAPTPMKISSGNRVVGR